jgi:hypothetical protein
MPKTQSPLPSAQWPHNVRPLDDYLGAYVPQEPEPVVPPPKNCQTCKAVSPLRARALLFLQSLTQARRRIGGSVGCEPARLAMRTLGRIAEDNKAGEGVTGD